MTRDELLARLTDVGVQLKLLHEQQGDAQQGGEDNGH
jgi:hypothetical protein